MAIAAQQSPITRAIQLNEMGDLRDALNDKDITGGQLAEALMYAISMNRTEAALEVIKQRMNPKGEALLAAIRSGNTAITGALVAKEADVNFQEGAPLKAAIEGSKPADMIGILANSGKLDIARVNAQDANGNTALILAAQRGHVPVIEALVKAGADVNIQNNEGKDARQYLQATRNNLASVTTADPEQLAAMDRVLKAIDKTYKPRTVATSAPEAAPGATAPTTPAAAPAPVNPGDTGPGILDGVGDELGGMFNGVRGWMERNPRAVTFGGIAAGGMLAMILGGAMAGVPLIGPLLGGAVKILGGLAILVGGFNLAAPFLFGKGGDDDLSPAAGGGLKQAKAQTPEIEGLYRQHANNLQLGQDTVAVQLRQAAAGLEAQVPQLQGADKKIAQQFAHKLEFAAIQADSGALTSAQLVQAHEVSLALNYSNNPVEQVKLLQQQGVGSYVMYQYVEAARKQLGINSADVASVGTGVATLVQQDKVLTERGVDPLGLGVRMDQAARVHHQFSHTPGAAPAKPGGVGGGSVQENREIQDSSLNRGEASESVARRSKEFGEAVDLLNPQRLAERAERDFYQGNGSRDSLPLVNKAQTLRNP